jgi:hypothetical protein
MAFIVTSAIIAGGSALYGIGSGIAKNAKANSIDKNNQRPTYSIPKEFAENVSLAKQMAQIGLPQQQYNNQLNAIGRNQASGLQTIGRSANPGTGVAQVVRASNDANNNLNAQDAAARQSNQRFFIGQNQNMAQQQLAKQQYDKFDNYTENFNRAQSLRGAANQDFNGAVNAASNVATGLAMASDGGFGRQAKQGPANWGYPDPTYRPRTYTQQPNNVVPDWGYMPPAQTVQDDNFNFFLRR